MSRPSPHALYEQTGGGDAYRIAMLEHGYTQPAAPWERNLPESGRMIQCGNTHPQNWTEWKEFESPYTNAFGKPFNLRFEARWCLTCGTTQAREVEENSTPKPRVDLSKPKVDPGNPEVTL